MLVKVPPEVLDLAELFEKKKQTLFVVGGFVRSAIMNLGMEDDVDLASSVPAEKVFEILKKSDFSVRYKNQTTGVLEIEKNGHVFEHATFRTESYAVAGEHMPCDVQFIDDLERDSDRRDFCTNAIYYNPLTGDVVDPQGGMGDIKKRTIRAVGSPNVLFKNDAERILRMVRFAASLGFDVDKKTYDAAKKNVFRLKFLSKARIQKEVKRILMADLAYPALGTRDAHVRGFNMLVDIGAIKYILPLLAETLDENKLLKNGQNTIEHVSWLVKFAPSQLRLSALMCLAGASKSTDDETLVKGYGENSSLVAAECALEFGLSKKEQNFVSLCARLHETFARDRLSKKNARLVVLDAREQAGKLAQFAVACTSAYKAHKFESTKSEQSLVFAIKQAYQKKFALVPNQLKLSNKDIKTQFAIVDEKIIAELKIMLLKFGAKKGKILTKDQNIKLVEKYCKKYF